MLHLYPQLTIRFMSLIILIEQTVPLFYFSGSQEMWNINNIRTFLATYSG